MNNLNLEDRVKWIEYKGVKILDIDFSNIREYNEFLQVLNKVTDMIQNSEKKVRHLSDFTNTYASSDIFEAIKRAGKSHGHLTEKRAAIGLKGVKVTLFNAFNYLRTNKEFGFFKTKIKALEFLIKDEY